MIRGQTAVAFIACLCPHRQWHYSRHPSLFLLPCLPPPWPSPRSRRGGSGERGGRATTVCNFTIAHLVIGSSSVPGRYTQGRVAARFAIGRVNHCCLFIHGPTHDTDVRVCVREDDEAMYGGAACVYIGDGVDICM